MILYLLNSIQFEKFITHEFHSNLENSKFKCISVDTLYILALKKERKKRNVEYWHNIEL